MKKIFLKDSKIKKILTILVTALILLIPISFISSVIEGRIDYKYEAVKSIINSWANDQKIKAPVMFFVENNKKETINKFALNTYEAKVDIKTEVRKKGIFKVPVYVAQITQKGYFDNSFGQLVNKQIKTKIEISDSRGFIEEPKFNINNLGYKNSQETEFSANITTSSKTIPFEITYKIKGMRNITFCLSGKKNDILMEGNWKDPSFAGDFLPVERKIDNEKFSAKWSVPQIAISKEESVVGVSLLVLNDNYSLAEKSLKYAFLLLSLIFIGYFIFEITTKENKKIHPIQYCLLGVSTLLFYLLLISISEIIAFNLAYFMSALMIVCLIYFYTYFVITKKDIKFSIGIAISISFLYSFFFTLLKLQDISMLIGSLGLFVLVAIIMYLTRNVNWYSE